MRTIAGEQITEAVAELYVEANVHCGADHLRALRRALETERSPLGRQVLSDLLRNAAIAVEDQTPLCADTGYAVCFVELGQDVHLEGVALQEAVDAGVREGVGRGYLRPSMVRSPINRINTGDNTPALVSLELVAGEACRLTLLVKGAGCDNMSRLRMCTPGEGVAAVADFVVETVELAGPSASPPVTVGVGLGGTFDRAALLAKRALTRPSGEHHREAEVAALEGELLERINATGIGPAGYGGTVTALAVHVETALTHIASLPVAVNLDCHSHRVGRRDL